MTAGTLQVRTPTAQGVITLCSKTLLALPAQTLFLKAVRYMCGFTTPGAEHEWDISTFLLRTKGTRTYLSHTQRQIRKTKSSWFSSTNRERERVFFVVIERFYLYEVLAGHSYLLLWSLACRIDCSIFCRVPVDDIVVFIWLM